MFPVTHVPIGRGLGLVLLLAGVLLAWWNPAVVKGEEGRTGLDGRQLGLGLGLIGLALLVIGPVAVFPWPTYGLMMGIGTVSATFLAMQWCARRGIPGEVVLEFALLGFAAGLVGGRLVYLIESWDSTFAAQPATILIGGDTLPQAGQELAVRTAEGGATVTFRGDEGDVEGLAQRLRTSLEPLGVTVEVIRVLHRGAQGVVAHTRGLELTTRARGEQAHLELVGGSALVPLGLQAGVAQGAAALPWTAMFDLSQGGLTFFGAVIGILLAWSAWIVHRKLPFWTILDAGAPVFPWGTAWGRMGCFARGCCWGREGGGALGVHYPPWSLPWYQMADERLSCRWDGALAEGHMTDGLRRALGPLADGTPALHPTQLYEGVGALLIFAFILLYQRNWQRRPGQSFALLILLQCPLRWVDDHLRRDHDYFFHLIPGYPMTVTQVSSSLLFLGGLALMIWLSRRPAPVAPQADPQPQSA